MKLSDKVYNVLKWVVQIVLPAVMTLYITLAGIWNWPYTSEVSLSLAAVTTFLGVVLGISTAAYNKAKKKDE